MLAVFKTGGKQYSVKAGQILKVEKLEGEKGDSISFKDVLAISESTQNTIGSVSYTHLTLPTIYSV